VVDPEVPQLPQAAELQLLWPELKEQELVPKKKGLTRQESTEKTSLPAQPPADPAEVQAQTAAKQSQFRCC
jgi:hypothetical protein